MKMIATTKHLIRAHGRHATLVTVLLGFWLTSAPEAAIAWGSTGHMVCAQIAYDRLEPDARAEADRLIAVLADLQPRNGHFVSASVWMDQLKRNDVRLFDTWHYVNLPYNADGLPTVPAAQPVNVITQIEAAIKTLESPAAGDFGKAFALRMLLHLVGDIHQPLHTVGRVTDENPDGDRGGNDFPVTHDNPEVTNLHSLWDSTIGLLPPVRPVGNWQVRISQHAKDVVDMVMVNTIMADTVMVDDIGPELQSASQQLDPKVWARESFQLAIDAAYHGIEEGGRPSPAYVKRAQQVASERMTLAGLRLAALLNRLLGQN